MSGCSESSPPLGTFVCSSAEFEGDSVDAKLIYGALPVLELSENGQGKFILGEDVGLVQWKLEGKELSVVFDGKAYIGNYQDDFIELDLLYSGLKMSFTKDGISDKEESESQVLTYYGWWDIGDASDGWQSYSGMWFDCCAVIELADNGEGEFILWDEDSSYEKPISRVKVKLNENNDISVVRGAFIDCEIDESNLIFSTENLEFSDMIVAELAYADEEGSFNSVIYLRPWGQLWDDVKDKAPELMPYHYDTWYLPLIEAGSQMPGEFELN